MTVRVGINGFGRIGRTYLRALLDRDEATSPAIEVVAVNDIAPVATLAHLLAYDSTYGRLPHRVTHDGHILSVGGQRCRGAAGFGAYGSSSRPAWV